MADSESAPLSLFSSPQPAAATLPHLITAFDARLLNGLVSINGAKLGVWKLPAPYDENDNFLPFREGVPLSAWALPYNQGDVLANHNIVTGEPILIVDSGSDEKALQAATDALEKIESGDDENQHRPGFQDLAELPALLAKIGWAIIPVGRNQDQALFISSPARKDYVVLLGEWCHRNGRAFARVSTDAAAPLTVYPAPDDARRNLLFNEGAEFANRMALYGIQGDELVAGMTELIALIKSQRENE